jgi:hypothetical protein
MKEPRLSKAETSILEQYWKLGTASVREVLESLPEDERVAYTTVQTLVNRLEEKGAPRKVKKIGNAQLFQPAIDQSQHSHLSYRLARLAGPPQTTYRAASLPLTSLFAAVIAAVIFQTIAHTACCFVLNR